MKKTDKDKIFFFLITTMVVLVLDQFTKYLASGLSSSVPVLNNIFHLTLVHNTGAGFGLFRDSASLLAWFSIIVIGIIIYIYDKIPKERYVQLFVALIFSGTIGNLIDRIRLGFVIDFIDFRIWPAFNIADSAVTVGTIGLIIYLMRNNK